MPDPALLAIVQHFTSPPALVQQVPGLMEDAEPFLSAYEAIADNQDREFASWVAGEAEAEKKARAAVKANPHDFAPQMFDELILPFGRHIHLQEKVTNRLERHSKSGMSPRLRGLYQRTLVRQRQQFEAARRLVGFLHEMRDEVVAHQPAESPPVLVPNETTIAAMREAEAGALPRFATMADLMADLHADD